MFNVLPRRFAALEMVMNDARIGSDLGGGGGGGAGDSVRGCVCGGRGVCVCFDVGIRVDINTSFGDGDSGGVGGVGGGVSGGVGGGGRKAPGVGVSGGGNGGVGRCVVDDVRVDDTSVDCGVVGVVGIGCFGGAGRVGGGVGHGCGNGRGGGDGGGRYGCCVAGVLGGVVGVDGNVGGDGCGGGGDGNDGDDGVVGICVSVGRSGDSVGSIGGIGGGVGGGLGGDEDGSGGWVDDVDKVLEVWTRGARSTKPPAPHTPPPRGTGAVRGLCVVAPTPTVALHRQLTSCAPTTATPIWPEVLAPAS